jgi:hypothetical protein
VTVESADPVGSSGACVAEPTLNLHHILTRQTWNAASQKFGPEHLYSHGRTCATHVMQLASTNKQHTLHACSTFLPLPLFNFLMALCKLLQTFRICINTFHSQLLYTATQLCTNIFRQEISSKALNTIFLDATTLLQFPCSTHWNLLYKCSVCF